MVSKPIEKLNKYAKNAYSQNGEDGILDFILRKIGRDLTTNFYVEFGAWDGKLFSNTYALLDNKSKALYIEADFERFKSLELTAKSNKNITAVYGYVDFNENSPNTLDKILSNFDVPIDFDILSIDIDSYDLEVWRSLKNFKPKIVVIEINSNFPPGIVFTHTRSGIGCSFTAAFEFGIQSGYSLLCHTGNLIFLRNDLTQKYEFEKDFLINSNENFEEQQNPKRAFNLIRNLIRVKFSNLFDAYQVLRKRQS